LNYYNSLRLLKLLIPLTLLYFCIWSVLFYLERPPLMCDRIALISQECLLLFRESSLWRICLSYSFYLFSFSPCRYNYFFSFYLISQFYLTIQWSERERLIGNRFCIWSFFPKGKNPKCGRGIWWNSILQHAESGRHFNFLITDKISDFLPQLKIFFFLHVYRSLDI